MNKREKELLDLAKQHKDSCNPEDFKSWLRGFRMIGTESEELKQEFDKLLGEDKDGS